MNYFWVVLLIAVVIVPLAIIVQKYEQKHKNDGGWVNLQGERVAGPDLSAAKKQEEQAKQLTVARKAELEGLLRVLFDSVKQPPRDRFTMDRDCFNRLVDDHADREVLTELARSIFESLGMSTTGFVIEVEELDASSFDDLEDKSAGSYQQLKNFYGLDLIRLRIRTDYFFDTVIAILCHECMHRFLRAQGVQLEGRADEELTDAACVYFGFWYYLKTGYEKRERQVQLDAQRVMRKWSRVGYLTVEEIEYLRGLMPGFLRRSEARGAGMARAEEGLRHMEMLLENMEMLVAGFGGGARDGQDWEMIQACLYARETGEVARRAEGLRRRAGEMAVDAALEREIGAFCEELARWNACLGRGAPA